MFCCMGPASNDVLVTTHPARPTPTPESFCVYPEFNQENSNKDWLSMQLYKTCHSFVLHDQSLFQTYMQTFVVDHVVFEQPVEPKVDKDKKIVLIIF